ncbi:MAG: hypothetical protein IPL50_19315 [Chitinophagaceae bacterium]|nr:hypothetical protein [Chitinophagaceae bacterium]
MAVEPDGSGVLREVQFQQAVPRQPVVAGGVTTLTAGGPTNGLPGVLGVGGAGGNEVASGQGTPTGPGEPGGVGGGLTGGSGLYNSANNGTGKVVAVIFLY